MKTHRVLPEDEHADMGIGTLYVLIATVLVAAVAAGVLLSVAQSAQNQALDTAGLALTTVASGLEVHEIRGDRQNTVPISAIAEGGPTVNIDSSSNNNPTVITTTANHYLLDGESVTIAGHSVGAVDGVHTITLIDATSFSIPVASTGGTGGTVQLEGTLALVTTTTAHGLSNGDSATIEGVTGSVSTPSLNGAHTIGGVTTTTFTLTSTTVNTGGTVTAATVTDPNLDEEVQVLELTVSLVPGSPVIAMENVLIQVKDDNTERVLRFDATESNTYGNEWTAHDQDDSWDLKAEAAEQTYTAEELRDPLGTFYDSTDSDNPDFAISKGTLVRIFIDLEVNDLDLSPQETMVITIMPKHGAPTDIWFETPEVYTERFVELAD